MRPRASIGAALVLCVAVAAPALAAPAPLDGQVNDDNSAGVGIDPARDAGVSDTVGGALTAGALEIPWAAFEQKTAGAQNIFVRAFKNGAWTTEGFPASLNVDATKEAEAPSIDFAGAGRTVPWVSWYEPNTAFGSPTQIFASRFASNLGSTGGGQWLVEGQDRTAGQKVPSLNIHTNRTAENPAVAGGAITPGADPSPWVAWEENDGSVADDDAHRQIFVSKGVKQPSGAAPCSGFKPAPTAASTGIFCWQQVGAERLTPTSISPNPSGDPSLNVDPTRAGVEPDVAFTGTSDSVPWVVWYEKGNSGLSGFRAVGNEQVFAAKGVKDDPADGGFHWQAVGAGTAGQVNPLDTSAAPHSFGPCAATQAADDACSLNSVATDDAENPRVASGTLTPGSPTVPWVVWDELSGGTHQVFLAHLVGGDHFELFNGGSPLSNPLNNASRPDIAFSNHEPYVSWQESVGGVEKLFLAHFEGGAAAPTFHLDTPDGIAVAASGLVPDLRAPISSTCTATPFSSDGTSCRAGALGTPFALFTDGATGTHKLLADAYAPSDVLTGDATSVTETSANVAGSANPGGAPVRTGFDFGPSGGALASSIAGPLLGASTAAQPFGATLSGLTSGTAIDYRATASSDFTTVAGATRSFTTATPNPGPGPGPTPKPNKPPSSRIAGLPARVRSRKLKSIHGTASDPDNGLAHVDVAITRATGGARAAAAARCLRLNARGRLAASRPVKGRCAPRFLRAKGTAKWRFALKHRLPKGHYVVYSRATDRAGRHEARFTRANRKALTVR